VAACRPVRVLLHHLLEERGDLVLTSVLRVPDVLSVVMARLSEWYWTLIRSKLTSSKPVSPVAMRTSWKECGFDMSAMPRWCSFQTIARRFRGLIAGSPSTTGTGLIRRGNACGSL
jgi:hypothetical protein